MPVLEELHRAFVPFSRRTAAERAQVLALAGLGVGLLRIKPVLARFQLADHGSSLLIEHQFSDIIRILQTTGAGGFIRMQDSWCALTPLTKSLVPNPTAAPVAAE